jgi:hypothetical protein
MYGNEVEMGCLGDEGWLQRGNLMPYIKDDREHFGGLRWQAALIAMSSSS